MLLKIEYSMSQGGVLFSGTENDDMPKHMYLLPIPIDRAIVLLSFMRDVILTGEPFIFDQDNYIITLSRNYETNSEDSICIDIIRIVGIISHPVFKADFEGYYGCENLLEGINKFKDELNEVLNTKHKEA